LPAWSPAGSMNCPTPRRLGRHGSQPALSVLQVACPYSRHCARQNRNASGRKSPDRRPLLCCDRIIGPDLPGRISSCKMLQMQAGDGVLTFGVHVTPLGVRVNKGKTDSQQGAAVKPMCLAHPRVRPRRRGQPERPRCPACSEMNLKNPTTDLSAFRVASRGQGGPSSFRWVGLRCPLYPQKRILFSTVVMSA